MAPSVLVTAAVLLVVLILGGVIGVSCIHERPEPAPRPSAATSEIPMRDLAGRERNPHRGMTPGALEAEAGAAGESNKTN